MGASHCDTWVMVKSGKKKSKEKYVAGKVLENSEILFSFGKLYQINLSKI